MNTKETKLLKTLIDFYAPDTEEKVIKYIFKNSEEYFDEEFFSELKSHISWQLEDKLYQADNDLKFLEENKDNKVTLDKKTKTMYFNDKGVPAYWYTTKMSKEDIKYHLNKYWNLWAQRNFIVLKYPELESYYSLNEWEKYYKADALSSMEETLELPYSSKSEPLRMALDTQRPLERLNEVFPDKIKKILTIDNFIHDDETVYADMNLLLYNDEECKVRVNFAKSGGSNGMSALGDKGFPMMTEHDDKLVRDTFWNTLVGEEAYRKNKYAYAKLWESVDKTKLKKVTFEEANPRLIWR